MLCDNRRDMQSRDGKCCFETLEKASLRGLWSQAVPAMKAGEKTPVKSAGVA
jgi:hypothetical protein